MTIKFYSYIDLEIKKHLDSINENIDSLHSYMNKKQQTCEHQYVGELDRKNHPDIHKICLKCLFWESAEKHETEFHILTNELVFKLNEREFTSLNDINNIQQPQKEIFK